MRHARRPRAKYAVTGRKKAAATRWQRRQRERLPLLAPLIAEAQPSIDEVMAERVERWDSSERWWRDQRAGMWRRARRHVDGHDPAVRRALLDYWNNHRWLPADPEYLLDMLHGFDTGRLVVVDGEVRPARLTIRPGEAVAAFGPTKPAAPGWLGKPGG